MATKKRTGDFAQTSVNVNVSITGSTTTGNASVSGLSSTSGFAPGLPITGAGIPMNSFIGTITPPVTVSGTTTPGSLTLVTAAGAAVTATATATGVALTIAGEVQVLGLQDWSLSWKRKTVEATTTDDNDYEDSLESTKSWTGKAKYAYLMGDASQQQFIRSILATNATSTFTFNFFPTDQQGDDVFSGTCIIDGLEIGSGTGKLVGADVSLKGKQGITVGTQLAPVAVTNTYTGTQAEV